MPTSPEKYNRDRIPAKMVAIVTKLDEYLSHAQHWASASDAEINENIRIVKNILETLTRLLVWSKEEDKRGFAFGPDRPHSDKYISLITTLRTEVELLFDNADDWLTRLKAYNDNLTTTPTPVTSPAPPVTADDVRESMRKLGLKGV